jgi:hypothetical protein
MLKKMVEDKMNKEFLKSLFQAKIHEKNKKAEEKESND